jgi:hypothetical protein
VRMFIPSAQLEKPRKLPNFGQRLILSWPFGETNAAAMRMSPVCARAVVLTHRP